MDFSSNVVAIIGAIALFLLYNLWRTKLNTKTKTSAPLPPQVSGALPLIGNLHQLGEKRPLARILSSIADKYGSIFMLRFGAHRTVVISNHKIMKEFYTTNDKFCSSRPQSTVARILSYNFAAFGFSPYGATWRDLRKLAMTDLLSGHRIRLMKHVQLNEVRYFMKELFLQCKENGNSVNVDMSELFESMVMNIITRMIAGKRYCDRHNNGDVEKGRHIGEIMKDFMLVAGAFVPSDMIPLLKWTECLGTVKNCKNIVKELDAIMESWIHEHEIKVNSYDNKDFIDVLLSKAQDDAQFGNSRRTVIKATAMSLILGGSDTTSITMTWLVAVLLNNKRVLQLAQEEIDEKVGRERNVEESDIEKLVYLNAIIKETLRLYPAGPLAVPREAMEDCTLYGYQIPKGTRILTNLWKLHRDPNIWDNPEEFRPERFLTSHVKLDYMGQNFEYVPFGSGRRSCPGLNFAMQVMHITIARFLQGFNLSTPNGEAVDMTESLSISLSKETPLHVIITPRLAPQLYE
ncbi:cytochrome P450 CYP82J17-like [Euphorbia lathyris]|uniref:cytochrome P450 CYP82J17-like n=1 Tax=Euphorbia lathyris TaxID=212925 RepID=UPI00331376BA